MQVGADREAMRVDLYVVTILGHPQIGIGVDGHLVQGLPERLAIVRVDLRTALDRLRRRLADQLDAGLVDQILGERTLLWCRGHVAIGREFDIGQSQKSLALVDKVAEPNRRGQRQAPDGSEQGAIDLHEELAVGKRERFKWACRLDSHPIYMWRGAKSLRRRGFGLSARLGRRERWPAAAGNRPERHQGRGRAPRPAPPTPIRRGLA